MIHGQSYTSGGDTVVAARFVMDRSVADSRGTGLRTMPSQAGPVPSRNAEARPSLAVLRGEVVFEDAGWGGPAE